MQENILSVDLRTKTKPHPMCVIVPWVHFRVHSTYPPLQAQESHKPRTLAPHVLAVWTRINKLSTSSTTQFPHLLNGDDHSIYFVIWSLRDGTRYVQWENQRMVEIVNTLKGMYCTLFTPEHINAQRSYRAAVLQLVSKRAWVQLSLLMTHPGHSPPHCWV